MKYRNNLVFYISKMYVANTKKKKIKSDCEAYKEDLDLLKNVCETVGITTASQMTMLISNLEKELDGAFSITEKRLGGIFLSAIFTGCFAPAFSEYLKNHFELAIPIFVCFIVCSLTLSAISIFEVELIEKFSYKGKRKKLLKMLCDINILYYSKEELDND